jgi:glycosyltransferase involved in cell wall biosynthesis
VCPVYCSEGTLGRLVDEIDATLSPTYKYEVILVDDGSHDSSWAMIRQICSSNPNVRGIRLGRNVGQHGALLAGIRSSRYEITVTLDDDLQNPPQEIPALINALSENVDVVYGVGIQSEHSWWRRLTSIAVRHLFRILLGYSGAMKISSFRAFKTTLREGFSGDLGPAISIDSLLTWTTGSFNSVKVKHQPRLKGKSNYNLFKLIRHMIDSATGYSIVPLRLASAFGMVVIFLGLGLFLWVTIRPFLTNSSVPGFPLLAASLAIFSGAQLLMLGILGEYIGKIHFRVMKKPTYTISDKTS